MSYSLSLFLLTVQKQLLIISTALESSLPLTNHLYRSPIIFTALSSAHYVNTTFHANEVSTTHRKSICFYEQDEGYPMQRHSNGQYVSATKNIAFRMKSASTVGNYGSFSFLNFDRQCSDACAFNSIDYSFTYIFCEL